MTQPKVWVNGRDPDDGIRTRANWTKWSGLFEPAQPERGATIRTFQGQGIVRADAMSFIPRRLSMAFRVLNAQGYNERWEDVHAWVESLAKRPDRIQVGSLYLDVELEPPVTDIFQAHASTVGVKVDGEANPATWRCWYGYAIGATQSIYVSDDRPDNSNYTMTGNPITITNPGSAPCYGTCHISGLTASTTYYLRNVSSAATRRVVVKTDSAGVAYISTLHGLVLMPGTNYIRVEAAAGTLVVAAAAKWGWYGTPWRYLGNDADKFNEAAVFFTSRRGASKYSSSATVVSSVGDMRGRIGLPLGDYAAATIGLVCEASSTNLIQYSDAADNAYWTKQRLTVSADAIAGPDAAVTADKLVETIDNNTHYLRRGSIFTAGQPAAMSVAAKAGERTWLRLGFNSPNINQNAWFDLTNGVIGTVGNAVQGKMYSLGGGWYRCCVFTNSAPDVFVDISIAQSDTDVASYVGDVTKGLYVAQMQGEALSIPTSPIGTSGATAARQADACALFLPHNYLQYSNDLTQGTASVGPWVRRGSIAPTRGATVGDTTAAGTTMTIAATPANHGVYQTLVPDIRLQDDVWTFAVAIRKTASSPTSIDLKLRGWDGTTGTGVYADYSAGATTTVTFADFPDATTTRTYQVTAPAGAAVEVMAEIVGNTGTGDFVVESARLVRGAFVGTPLITENESIPLPAAGYPHVDSLRQNGWIQVKAVLPPISAGLTYDIFGSRSATYAIDLAVYRDTSSTTAQQYLAVKRKHSGGTVTRTGIDVSATGNPWDGALHTYRLEWTNYIASGTRYCFLRLYFDGVQVLSTDEAVANSVTSWNSPSQLVLSDGSAYSTIREVSLGYPSLPAGAYAEP